MSRKILIVDDNAINRKLLKGTLSRDYDIMEAENGREAMTLIHRNFKVLSAVLLDIVMPEMDGYEVLRSVRDNAMLAQIPIIVVTGSEDEESRVKALACGANDFILKPFNPEIVKHILRNNIALRETASILNAIQKDKLTTLYNREAFFEHVKSMISDREPGYYILSCFDIDNFKLINDQFGAIEGDRVLQKVGRVAKEEMAAVGGIAGRISADNFAALFPATASGISIFELLRARNLVLLEQQAIVFSVGRYVVNDLSLSASAIYDRAYIAKQSVKGRYDKHMAYFDEQMLQRLVLNQQITGEMETAIATRQFEVWFQPQYNHATGGLIGAEVLTRWRHPQKGIISPGDFIPLFEQTGFVYELDKFVWEESCRYLRKWIDAGRNPKPLSMNVSRYDIFRTDLIDVITGLVDKYSIPVELIRLEITESAFATSTDIIVSIVKQLIDRGFTIEIDDFGSGYSSLNTLKNVPAQVLKLDMRFLEEGGSSQRGGTILESVVRMAKWLGMSVLAEGVELPEQANFLQSIGCSYVQGYLYAAPMSAMDYEALCCRADKEDQHLTLDVVAGFRSDTFWDPQSLDSLVFNQYVGGACVYEYRGGQIELIRVTDKYAHMVFGPGVDANRLMQIDWTRHVEAQSNRALLKAMERTIETREDVTGEYEFYDLPGCPKVTALRSTLRAIASSDDRHLIYCISENITAQRQAEKKERAAKRQTEALAKQLHLVLSSIDSAVLATAYEQDGIRLIFANDQYYAQFGYTKEEYEATGYGPFAFIHPDDRERLREISVRANREKEPYAVTYRILHRDGTVRWRHRHVSFVEYPGETAPVQLAVASDITALMAAENKGAAMAEQLQAILDNVSSGVAATALYPDGAKLIFANDRLFDILGVTRAEYENGLMEIVFDEDVPLVQQQMHKSMQTGEHVRFEYRIIRGDGEMVWLSQRITEMRFVGTDAPIRLSVVYDVTAEKVAEQKILEAEAQKTVLINSIEGGIATYTGAGDVPPYHLRLTYFSDGLCRLFGYTRKEYEKLVVNNPAGLVFPEDLPTIMGQIGRLLKDGTPVDCVYRAHTKSGGYCWINLKASRGGEEKGLVTANAVFFDVTAQQETLEQLRVSEEENKLAIAHSQNVVCRYDVATHTLTVSPNVKADFEMPSVVVDVPYAPVREGKISPETAEAYTAFYENILGGEKDGGAIFQRLSTNGWRWVEAHFSSIFSNDGHPVSAVISFVDVTERLEKDAVYQRWQQSLSERPKESYSLYRCNVSKRTAFDASDGTLLTVQFEQGVFRFDEYAEKYAAACVLQEDVARFIAFLNSDALVSGYYQGRRILVLDYREKLPKDDVRWLRLTVDLIASSKNADIEAYLLFEDIDKVKRAEIAKEERARTDPLTGILNRTALKEQADRLLRAAEPGAQHALLMMDLDGFKLINDAFGHGVGDQALIDVARQLESILRRDDMVGRLGGDEFIVVLNNVPDDKAIARKAAKICEQTRKTYSMEVQRTVSIGIAVYPRDGTDFEQLYKKADEALYYVKDSGRNNYTFYRDDMRENTLEPLEQKQEITPVRLRDRKRQMLIVDDSAIDFELMAKLFRDTYTIEKAKDGNAAMIRLRHYGSAISVVLLDLMMPGMDGFAVLEKMQQSPELKSIPVVVVSGDDDLETSLRAIRCGASDYVTKPIDPEVLNIRVASAISKAENEQLRAKNSYLELQANELSSYLAVLNRLGLGVAETDWGKGTFTYSPSMGAMLAGQFDGRPLWHILLSDLVTDATTVRQLQQTAHGVAADRKCMEKSLSAPLKTPSGGKHIFDIMIYKLANEYGLTDRLILTFRDTGVPDREHRREPRA